METTRVDDVKSARRELVLARAKRAAEEHRRSRHDRYCESNPYPPSSHAYPPEVESGSAAPPAAPPNARRAYLLARQRTAIAAATVGF